jgi:hypothetical protein
MMLAYTEMQLTLTIKTTDDVAKERQQILAQRVLVYFGNQPSERRLLCFLDDQEWEAFKAENGAANRGFYSPIRAGDPQWRIAPTYILEHVFVRGVPAFDDLIYLHGSTCSNDVGLTMTFAHELQHFVQYAEQRRLWAANALVPNLSKDAIEALGLKWCDIPHEREARIVSKRTAESLFGPEVVRQFIDSKIAQRVTEEDAADWECIRELATSTSYNLAHETKLFFPRLRPYRSELECALGHFQSNDPDFAGIDLAALLSASSE